MPPTAEPPAQTKTHDRKPLNVDRDAIRTASIAGVSDADLARAHPGVTQGTIRQWRNRDPVWKAAFQATAERPATLTAPTKPDTHAAKATPAPVTAAVTSAIIEANLETIGARNRVRVASLIDKSLSHAEKARKPLPIKTHADLSQAYRTLRLTTGEDSESAQVQVNIWGNPGLTGQTTAPAFRNVEGRSQPLPIVESSSEPPAATD
jgi:hypothetical protein